MMDVEILECTLRDGSYPVSYQFTAEDTAVIAAGLQEAGFRRIEVGHGLGLGASRPEIGVAAATDREYLAAAASVLGPASLGVFFIPGIGEAHHIDMAASSGANFIRIGTDVTASEEAEPYILQAKELGLEVSSNLMKTYALEVEEVVQRAVKLDELGVDIIAVVDSAGTMLPDAVRSYVEAVDDEVDSHVGFHGHDNLRLAISNTLAAIDAGARVVDTSLRGLGRSAGNAQTEVLLGILERRGLETGIDLFAAMSLSEEFVAPLSQGQGIGSIELCSGYGGFHSKFLPTLRRVAEEEAVDLRKLIIAVSEQEQVDITEELARRVARGLQGRSPRTHPHGRRPRFELKLPDIQDGRPESWRGLSQAVADELSAISKKTGKTSIFTIAWSPDERDGSPEFPFIRGDGAYIVGNAEVRTASQAREIAEIVDGSVDYIAADVGRQSRGRPPMSDVVRAAAGKSQLLPYSDHLAHVDAAYALLQRQFPDLPGQRLALAGLSSMGTRLAIRLVEQGCSLALWDPSKTRRTRGIELVNRWRELHGAQGHGEVREWEPGSETVPALMATAVRREVVTEELVRSLGHGGQLLDLGVGSLEAGAVEAAKERKIQVTRLDMRAGLFGHLITAIETDDLVTNVLGRESIAGITIVAGGVVGERGDVVVDTAHNPTRVIGVADGRGGLLARPDQEGFLERMKAVRKEILARRLDL